MLRCIDSKLLVFGASVIAARKLLHVSGRFWGPRPRWMRGRRNAERRALVVKMRPSDAPPRRLLRPWDRSSGRRRERTRHPGRLSPALRLSRPATEGSAP
jgi:hypothetical protein